MKRTVKDTTGHQQVKPSEPVGQQKIDERYYRKKDEEFERIEKHGNVVSKNRILWVLR